MQPVVEVLEGDADAISDLAAYMKWLIAQLAVDRVCLNRIDGDPDVLHGVVANKLRLDVEAIIVAAILEYTRYLPWIARRVA